MSACKVKRDVNTNLHTTIGGRIREALRRRRWDLTELAEKAEIPYRTLQTWSAPGRDTIPSHGVVTISRTLDISAAWLLTGFGSMEPEAEGVALPSVETLEELRDWLARVLPSTSPASGPAGLSAEDVKNAAAAAKRGKEVTESRRQRRQGGKGNRGSG